MSDTNERARVTDYTAADKPESIALYRPFPTHLLPPALRAVVESGSKAAGVDSALYALPLLTVAGAAIGTTRRVWIKRNWRPFPTVWALPAVESGKGKSQPFSDALVPVYQRQAELDAEYAEQLAGYKADVEQFKRELAEWRRDGTGDSPEEPMTPPRLHAYTTEPTGEAVASMLAAGGGRGLLLARDELAGWFGSFNAYRGGKGGDEAFWLTAFDGKPAKIDRKGSGSLSIERAAAWVCGTIQPSVMRRTLAGEAKHARGDDAEHVGNGMAARILLACPPPRVGGWREDEMDAAAEARWAELIGRLYGLAPKYPTNNLADDAPGEPIDLALTDAARELFAAWVDELAERRAEQRCGAVRAARSKIEAYAAKLALIDTLCREPDAQIVDERAMAAGIGLARWFADEACRVYALLGIGGDGGDLAERRRLEALAELVRDMGGSATRSTLRDRRRHYKRDPDAAEADMRAAAKLGLGQLDYPAGPGRPALTFRVHQHLPVPVPETQPEGAAEPGYRDGDAKPKSADVAEHREVTL